MQTKLIWTQVWSLKRYVTVTLRSTFAAAVAAAHDPLGVPFFSVISFFKKGWYLS